MNDKRIEHIPKILETPKGKEHLEDVENIKILKSLVKG
jgi:endonuclease IV